MVPAAAAVIREADADWGLVERARSGDLDSFEKLYRVHVGRVLALCARICGDRSRAEDLAQEVFVRAWERLSSFRGESLFSSWLHRLAVNVALGDARARSRRFDTSRPTAVVDDLAGRPGAADPALGRDLERAIGALPEGAREILVLHDIQGYRHEEIAEMTGRQAGTCRAQLHRARRLLREALR